ncbi:MAG: BatA domain-containing protein, partial [Deltaproteobacteria bacterium]|nr:BatA domain-containing protein [Deltaproteobacteria bacterium]
MAFDNGYFLAALSLAAIPLILHLILRKKAAEIKFSALEFLIEKNRRVREILRIQSITLLMIRICAILFLVLAFAKPNLVIEKAISAQSG